MPRLLLIIAERWAFIFPTATATFCTLIKVHKKARGYVYICEIKEISRESNEIEGSSECLKDERDEIKGGMKKGRKDRIDLSTIEKDERAKEGRGGAVKKE